MVGTLNFEGHTCIHDANTLPVSSLHVKSSERSIVTLLILTKIFIHENFCKLTVSIKDGLYIQNPIVDLKALHKASSIASYRLQQQKI